MIHRTLSNGLEVALKENHFSRMVALQCWVGVGSLWEEPHEYGMAHCLEHMLFKGTENYGVGEISAKVEAYGGDMNAYTSFDRTVFYLTISSEYLQEGIALLADAVLRSTFDAEELVKEKEVILEEIRRSLDQPGHLLGRKIFERIYANTAAARPIIGFQESVEKFSRDDLVRFHRDWYTPDNMRIVAVGDFDTKDVFTAIENAFGAEQRTRKEKTSIAPVVLQQGTTVEVIRGDYEQARVEMAFNGPDQGDFDAVELDLAAFCLGSGESSRLIRKIRDEKSFASSLGASVFAPDFPGIFEVSAVPTDGHLLDCIEQLATELARLKYHEPISPAELRRARTNLKAERLHQEESVAGQARALGYSLTTPQKMAYDAVYDARIDASSGESIYNAVNRWINLDQATLVVLLPNDCAVSETAIREAYFKGVQKGKAGTIDRFMTLPAREADGDIGSIYSCELAPGLSFVYRRNPQIGLFNLVAVTAGGLRRESESNFGIHNCIADMLATATDKLDNKRLTDFVEGHGAVLVGFSGKDSIGLRLQSFFEDSEKMIELFANALLKPAFPDTQWKNVKLDIYEDILAEKDSPASIAVKAFRKLVYGDHPYNQPLYGSRNNVDGFNPSSLLEAFSQVRDKQPWVISGVGSESPETVLALLKSYLGSWQPQVAQQKEAISLGAQGQLISGASYEKIEKSREQTHLIVGTLGLQLSDERRFALDVLTTVLGGSGGRLFINLRDKQSLAYTVSPLLSYGCDPGLFGIYIACAPSKVSRALDGIRSEMNAMCDRLVSEDELVRARNYLTCGHEASMQRGESQAMSMALMSLYGLGADEFLRYADNIKKVTREQVRDLAKELLDPSRLVCVEVGPTDETAREQGVSNG